MLKRASGRLAQWQCCVLVAAMLTPSSCLVMVSTGPTALVGGNIVFVAIDGRGGLVASLRITVVDLAGDWRHEGMTAHDGSFRCDVRSGVTRPSRGHERSTFSRIRACGSKFASTPSADAVARSKAGRIEATRVDSAP
jgi:hypothetical protein